MTFIEGVIQYKWVIAFYLAIILFIIIYRKKFEFQGKVIALYRTKFGLNFIEKMGKKHSELVKILGYCGIGIGFVGMFAIVILILKGFVDLIFVPNAPPVISPVLPGVPIPGSPVYVPLIEGILALFIVVVVHEFAHGVVARAHNVKVQSTGIVFFGPIIGAFVEPDEKQVEKKSDVVKYSIFAAGPFSNVILALIAVFVAAFILTPVTNHFAHPVGVTFTDIEDDLPADLSGMQIGEVYTFVNSQNISSLSEFETALSKVEVGDTITIGNSQKMYEITTTSRNATPDRAVIGVNVKTKYTNEDKWWMQSLLWITGLVTWIFILSLGLGLANLLPLGPVDGGRMIKEALENIQGKKKGISIWVKVTIFMIVLILILLLIPIIKAIFS